MRDRTRPPWWQKPWLHALDLREWWRERAARR